MKPDAPAGAIAGVGGFRPMPPIPGTGGDAHHLEMVPGFSPLIHPFPFYIHR
ncbi:MAG: hypothetical protein ABIR47_12710 [Candidatus Kapaibacterium sp.]